MIGRLGERLPAALLGAVGVVGCALFAHVAAGGRVAGPAALALLTVAVAALAVALASTRPTFIRLLAIAAGAQPLLHVAFGSLASHTSPSHAHHAGAQHATMLTSTDHASATMWIVHLVAAVVTAVVVRWGWRWLRSMPELLRAIAYSIRSVAFVEPAARVRRVAAGIRIPNQLALLTWDERGPPRSE